MKFNINFNPFKKKEARQEERSYNFLSDSLFYNSATTYSESKAMLLSAVY
ncbi:phage portal protein, partial [Bacteroides xylanisolvens]